MGEKHSRGAAHRLEGIEREEIISARPQRMRRNLPGERMWETRLFKRKELLKYNIAYLEAGIFSFDECSAFCLHLLIKK